MHHTLLFLTASQQICGCVTAVELFVCVSLQMVVLLLPDLHAELSTSKLVLPYLQVVRCSPRHPSLHQNQWGSAAEYYKLASHEVAEIREQLAILLTSKGPRWCSLSVLAAQSTLLL